MGLIRLNPRDHSEEDSRTSSTPAPSPTLKLSTVCLSIHEATGSATGEEDN